MCLWQSYFPQSHTRICGHTHTRKHIRLAHTGRRGKNQAQGLGWQVGRDGGKGVHRCRFRCLQISMSNVDRVPCKCRWKCRIYTNLSRKKSPKKPESYVEKMQNHMLIYIYIYIYIHTHTHTHTQRLIFQAFSRGPVHKIRDWLQKMSMSIEKTCKCRIYVDVDGSYKCRPDMVDICALP